MDPLPLCAFDRGGLGHSKVSSCAGNGAILSLKCKFCCHSEDSRVEREKSQEKHGRDLGLYLTLLAVRRTLLAQRNMSTEGFERVYLAQGDNKKHEF